MILPYNCNVHYSVMEWYYHYMSPYHNNSVIIYNVPYTSLHYSYTRILYVNKPSIKWLLVTIPPNGIILTLCIYIYIWLQNNMFWLWNNLLTIYIYTIYIYYYIYIYTYIIISIIVFIIIFYFIYCYMYYSKYCYTYYCIKYYVLLNI